MIQAPPHLHYTLIHKGKAGRLNDSAYYMTGIAGHDVDLCTMLDGYLIDCWLRTDGALVVREGTMWDFGSGPAIDTPSVVIASLAHDMLCHLTNLRLIPWSCRSQADKMYRVMLAQNGSGVARRWWQYAAVRAYSETVARWRDKRIAGT